MILRRYAAGAALLLLLSTLPAAADLQPPFRKLWAFDNPDQLDNVAYLNNLACFGSFKNYGTVDLRTGRVVWQKSFKDPAFGAQVLPDRNTLYVMVGKSHLAAHDLATGRERWRLPARTYAYPLAFSGNLLYAMLEDGVLTALDRTTRRAAWTLRMEPKPRPRKPGAYDGSDHGISVAPLLLPGRLLVASSSGSLFCAEPKTGKLLWKSALGGRDIVQGWTPVGGRVLINRQGGPTEMLDSRTGKRVWVSKGTEVARGAPAVRGGLAFVAAEPGMLFALDLPSGAVRWSKRLSTAPDPDVSPPVIAGDRVVLAVDNRVLAFTPSGVPAWTYELNDSAFSEPLQPLADGFVLVGSHDIFRFEHGEPPPLPSGPAGRRALAESLIGRVGRLSGDDRKTLLDLGEDAYAVLLPRVKRAQAAYEAAGEESEDSFKLYSRFKDLLEALTLVVTPDKTPDMVAMLPKPGPKGKDESVRSDILQLIAEKGDKAVTVPLFLDILRSQPFGEETYAYSAGNLAISVVQESSDPSAVDYLIGALKDPKALATVRAAAFTNLARTGGERGLQAVLAARDQTRTLPAFAERMALDQLGTKPDPRKWPTRLLAVHVDAQETLWGLATNRLLGSEGDLWLLRHDGSAWTRPVFTGVDTSTQGFRRSPAGEDAARAALAKRLLGGEWVKAFVGNPALTRDSDGDGWTDLVEKRIGTDPARANSDGDGLQDSRDRNPLAPARAVDDREQILQAALEARFFEGSGSVPLLVTLPPGIHPLEFRGYPWIVCAVEAKEKHGLDQLYGKGVGLASFSAPRFDLKNAANTTRDWEKDWLLMSADRTEAKTSLSVYYGGLNGTVYDIRLRKFGHEWLVVEMKMTAIS